MGHIRSFITLFVFVFLLMFFLANQLIPFVSDVEYNENKKKAELPVLDLNYLDRFPEQFEAYLSDNFSLRGVFLKNMGDLNSRVWKKSPKPDKLILGNDNWLFNVDKELDYYLGKTNFTESELAQILNDFENRKKILDKMGIEMYFVINPIKYTVYPEYLPNYLQGSTVSTIADQLIAYFNEHSSIEIIYPKNELIENKQQALLYYKTDNHWNEIGGFYASKYIINKIIQKFNIPELQFKSFCVDTVLNWQGNLAQMTANAKNYDEYRYNFSLCENEATSFARYKYKPIDGFVYAWDYQKSFITNNENLPNALIIRDSYGDALIPFMKNSFYHSTFIFDAWQYGLNLKIIEKEKPDLVVYMVLESLLPNLLKEK